VPANSAGEQDSTLEMDSGSIAMIAMLLLFNVGVVAAIMAVRSKSRLQNDGRQRAMVDFERDLFADTGPVANLLEMSEYSPPPTVEPESVQHVDETVSDLPNIGDLLD
jgi:hypothetical protein